MKRHIWTILAIVSVLVLAFLAERYSNTDEDGVATRAVAISPTVPAGPMAPASSVGCTKAPPPPEKQDAETPGETVTITGACEVTVTGPLFCGENEDVFNGSIGEVLDDDDDFYLTVVIPEFKGNGEYKEAELFAQIGGDSSARWSSRFVTAKVDDEGVHFTDAKLGAEPGTLTTGSLNLSGNLPCGNEEEEE